MSKSFDQGIGERLIDHTAEPPKEMKDAILKEVSEPLNSSTPVYGGVAAILMLLALFEIGKVDQVENIQTTESAFNPTREKVIEKHMDANSPEVDFIDRQKQRDELQLRESKRGRAESIESGVLTAFEPEKMYQTYQGSSFGFKVSTLEMRRPIHLSPRRTVSRPQRIVPKRKRFFDPYINTGAFFTYNRVQPNLTDDIYVGEYDSPFGISASRLGFLGEVGLERRLSEVFSTRLGISINNYRQHYSFVIRGTQPDSVGVNEETGFLEPQFETERMQISERVTTVGLRLTGLWKVFPGEHDVLFGSVEYQRLLGEGPGFTYEDRRYYLMDPTQILLELGLKKTVIELEKGSLYLMPNIRYSVSRIGEDQLISVKPFSMGVTISYGLK